MSDLEQLHPAQVQEELQRGGRIVIYDYCISLIFISFQRSSDPVLVRAGESPAAKSLPYTLLTLVAGWWGIPFGIIFTIMALFTNLRGGRDITDEFIYHQGW